MNAGPRIIAQCDTHINVSYLLSLGVLLVSSHTAPVLTYEDRICGDGREFAGGFERSNFSKLTETGYEYSWIYKIGSL